MAGCLLALYSSSSECQCLTFTRRLLLLLLLNIPFRHMRRLTACVLWSGGLVGAAAGLAFHLARGSMPSWFTSDPAVEEALLSGGAWTVLALAQPMNGLLFVFDGLMYATQVGGNRAADALAGMQPDVTSLWPIALTPSSRTPHSDFVPPPQLHTHLTRAAFRARETPRRPSNTSETTWPSDLRSCSCQPWPWKPLCTHLWPTSGWQRLR